MGKKSRRKEAKCAPPKVQIDDDITLEALLNMIISEYIQTTGVPGGMVEESPRVIEGHETICLRPSFLQNFNDFMISAKECDPKLGRRVAFAWWARSRIRYSCSTITAAMVRFIIPYMKKYGKTKLYSKTLGRIIEMEDLEIYTLGFIPNKTHAIMLKYPFLPPRTEVVEALFTVVGEPDRCSHNVLKCRKTGIIIDPTLGQFLGAMNPFIFNDTSSFNSRVPGQVLYFNKTNNLAIDEQISRDSTPRLDKFTDSMPDKFTERIFRSFKGKKKFCRNCKGVASNCTDLKKCNQCKNAYYCCRDCQSLDWKSHKEECKHVGNEGGSL